MRIHSNETSQCILCSITVWSQNKKSTKNITSYNNVAILHSTTTTSYIASSYYSKWSNFVYFLPSLQKLKRMALWSCCKPSWKKKWLVKDQSLKSARYGFYQYFIHSFDLYYKRKIYINRALRKKQLPVGIKRLI